MPDTLLGGIVTNEILADPNSSSGANFDTDGNGTAANLDEYVELYNTSSSPIDISGLELWDAGVGHWFTFPPGTILNAGGHAMVMAGLQTGGLLPTGNPGDLFFEVGLQKAQDEPLSALHAFGDAAPNNVDSANGQHEIDQHSDLETDAQPPVTDDLGRAAP